MSLRLSGSQHRRARCRTPGAAGLTLGGGFGRIARKFGLACDNMIGADLVTAGGKLVRASASENPNLLWGLRGGGGNFGIVTSFEYRLYPVDPMMYGGPLVFPLEQARDVLTFFSGYALEAPDDLYADCFLVTTPDGHKALVFDICYSGPVDDAERVLKPLRAIRKPDTGRAAVRALRQTAGQRRPDISRLAAATISSQGSFTASSRR